MTTLYSDALLVICPLMPAEMFNVLRLADNTRY